MNKQNLDITNDICRFLSDPNGWEIDINLNTKVQDLGLDSIDYVTLLVNLEERFEIGFEVECLKPDFFETISDIVEYIRKHESSICQREG